MSDHLFYKSYVPGTEMFTFKFLESFKSFNPKYLKWYSPSLDLKHTTQVCRGENVIIMGTYF